MGKMKSTKYKKQNRTKQINNKSRFRENGPGFNRMFQMRLMSTLCVKALWWKLRKGSITNRKRVSFLIYYILCQGPLVR